MKGKEIMSEIESIEKDNALLSNSIEQMKYLTLGDVAKNGYVEVLSRLLNLGGIDVNAAVGDDDYTALHIAVENGHVNLVQALLEVKGIDVNTTARNGVTALHIAVKNGHVDLVKALLEVKGIDVDAAVGDDKYTPLHIAVKNGRVDLVEALLEVKGIDVDAKDNNGLTALHLAVMANNIDMVKLLIQKGADPLLTFRFNGNDRTARDWAQSQEMKEFLCDGEYTALHIFVNSGDVDSVKALLKAKKIDINATAGHGVTALHVAARNGHIELAELLLTNGADPLSKAYGHTPRDCAKSQGMKDLLEEVEKKQIDHTVQKLSTQMEEVEVEGVAQEHTHMGA